MLVSSCCWWVVHHTAKCYCSFFLPDLSSLFLPFLSLCCYSLEDQTGQWTFLTMLTWSPLTSIVCTLIRDIFCMMNCSWWLCFELAGMAVRFRDSRSKKMGGAQSYWEGDWIESVEASDLEWKENKTLSKGFEVTKLFWSIKETSKKYQVGFCFWTLDSYCTT